jgi:hypothetical protein
MLLALAHRQHDIAAAVVEAHADRALATISRGRLTIIGMATPKRMTSRLSVSV